MPCDGRRVRENRPAQDPLVSEDTVKVSDHVWAIMGWPNIGIVVGENATLVVDTGLGPRNGATVARVAKRLAPNNKLYLTTTHFHPEHAGGVSGFPDGTILIRPKVQQDEMDKHGEEMIHLFESMKRPVERVARRRQAACSGQDLRQGTEAGSRRRRDGAAAVVRRCPHQRR